MAFDVSAFANIMNNLAPLLQMYMNSKQQGIENERYGKEFEEKQRMTNANIENLNVDAESKRAEMQRAMQEQRTLDNARQSMGKFGQIVTTPSALAYYKKPEFREEVKAYDQTPAKQIPNIPQEDQAEINKPASEYYGLNKDIVGTDNQYELFQRLGNLQYMDKPVATNSIAPVLNELTTNQKQSFDAEQKQLDRDAEMQRVKQTQNHEKQFWGSQINPETNETNANTRYAKDFDKSLRDSVKKETSALKEYTSLVDLITTETDAKKLSTGLTAFRVPRLSGEVGALTKTDQDKRFVESIIAKAEQAYYGMIKGEMSPTNKNALIAYANLMKSANSKHALNIINSQKKSASTYLGDRITNNIATPVEELFIMEDKPIVDSTTGTTSTTNDVGIDFKNATLDELKALRDALK